MARINYFFFLSFFLLSSTSNEPPNSWPAEAYVLIGREDLARQAGNIELKRETERLQT